MIAARSGNVEIVRALIASGADLDAKDPDGDTALTIAGKAGKHEIIYLLENAGAKRTQDLIVACALGDIPTVKTMLEKALTPTPVKRTRAVPR